jgi:DNA-binding FadR family transcriptional regulator
MERFFRDLFQVREIIEPAAAAIAAEKQLPDDVAEIARAYQAMVEAADDDQPEDDWTDADLRFHQAILSATGNELLGPLGSLIEAALAISFKLTSARPLGRINSLPRHKIVLDAIERGDPAAAREAMRGLLGESIDDLQHVIGDMQAKPPRRRSGQRKRPLA